MIKTRLGLLMTLMLGLPNISLAELSSQNNFLLELSVTSPDESMRMSQMQAALRELLTKLTHTETILELPAVVEALEHPEIYITQFSYQGAMPDLKLRCRFNEALIKKLLQAHTENTVENGQACLVWALSMDSAGLAQWVAPPLSQAPNANFKLFYPLNDYQDWAILSPMEGWAENLELIKEASLRYEVEDFLLIKFINEAQWQADCTFVQQQTSHTFRLSGSSQEELLAQASTQVSQYYQEEAPKPASVKEDEPLASLEIAIVGIENPSKYGKVIQYFEQLPGVTHAELSRLAPNYTVFKLEVRGGRLRLERALQRSHELVSTHSVDEDNLMTYRLKP